MHREDIQITRCTLTLSCNSWLNIDASDVFRAAGIRDAVDLPLTMKGWRRVEPVYSGFGDSVATTTTVNTKVGSLVVDIFDSATKHLIWRATAEDALSDKPEKNIKKLDNSVKDMLEHFPPKGRD